MLAPPLLVLVTCSPCPLADPPAQLKPIRSRVIQEGLVWLARHQNEDGSWGGSTLAQRCKGERPCSRELKLDGHYDSGLTGLALCAFLRNGFGPLSKKELVDPLNQGKIVAGEVVTRGLSWLRKIQKPDGSYAHEAGPTFLYNEAVAEIALAEACALDKTNEDWRNCTRKGLDYLQAAQRKNLAGSGLWGWRYASRPDAEQDKQATPQMLCESDTSATGWAVAALEAAARAGLEPRQEALAGALEFLSSVAVPTGLVGYNDSRNAGLRVQGRDDNFEYHVATMSAIGILIRLRTTSDTANPFLDAAAKHIVEDPPHAEGSSPALDYYYWYHASEALNRLEGSEFAKGKKRHVAEPWNKSVSDALFALQDHQPRACSSGGWVARDRWAYAGGPVYCTAMALLTLKLSDGK